MTMIYKICPQSLWQVAEQEGVFKGAAIDLIDGYIHFSSGEQVIQTARLHFAGQDDLVLVEADPATLEITWESSRGGQLFPHLYGVLPMTAVRRVMPLGLGADGMHIFPDGFAAN